MSTVAEHQDLDRLTVEQFRVHVRNRIQGNYPPKLRNPPQRLHFKDTSPGT